MPTVHTSTYDAVLAPIAQAVGELVVLQDEAASSNAEFPDLSGTALAITMSTSELIKVAIKVKETTQDPLTKSAMGPAIQLCENSSKQFSESTAALKVNPNSLSAISSLTIAAKDLLAGTTKILQTFDDNEVRKILAICDAGLAQLEVISKVTTIKELAACLKTVCNSLVEVAKATERRSGELTSPPIQSQLREQNDIVRNASPTVISSTKTYVTTVASQAPKSSSSSSSLSSSSSSTEENNTNNNESELIASARSSKDFVVGRVRDAINEIKRIVQLKFVLDEDAQGTHPSDASNTFGTTASTYGAMSKLQAGGSAGHASKNLQNLAVRYGEMVALIKQIQDDTGNVAENVADKDKSEIIATSGRLEENCDRLAMKAIEIETQSRFVLLAGNGPSGAAAAAAAAPNTPSKGSSKSSLTGTEESSVIRSAIMQVAQARREMIASALRCADELDNKERRKETQAKIAVMSEKVSQLEVLVTGQAMENANAILHALHSPLREMIEAANTGNTPAHGLASDRFEKVSVQLGNAIQTACAFTSDPERAKRLDGCCTAVLNLVPEMINATRTVAILNQEIQKQAQDKLNQQQQGGRSGSSSLSSSNSNIAAAAAAAAAAADVDEGNSGGAGSTSSEITSKTTSLIGGTATANLLLKNAQDHLATMQKEWDAAMEALERALDDVAAPNTMLDALTDDLKNNQLNDFLAGVESRDAKTYERATNALKERVSHIIIAAKAEAARSKDPEFIKTIDNLCTALEKARDHLIATGDAAFADPSPANKAALSKATNQFAIAVTNIEIAVRSKGRGTDEAGLPVVPRHKVMDHVDAVFSRIEADEEKAKRLAEAKKREEEEKARREAELAAAKAAAEAAAAAAAAAAEAQRKAEEEARLKAELQAAEEARLAAEAARLAAEAAAEAQRKAEEEARQLQAAEEARRLEAEKAAALAAAAAAAAAAALAAAEDSDEEEENTGDKNSAMHQIKIAAKELRDEARKWSSEENALIALATDLSKLMAEMAEHAHHHRKGELVKTAKLMCSRIVEIEKIAREIARACPNKKLSKQLLDYVDRVPTISNQLRVISSVKAANPDDSETDAQLVVCARNLMRNVTHIVQSSEAACVPLQQVTHNNPLISALKWTRRLKKRAGDVESSPYFS